MQLAWQYLARYQVQLISPFQNHATPSFFFLIRPFSINFNIS